MYSFATKGLNDVNYWFSYLFFFKVDLQPINVNNKTENQTESIINFNVKNSNVKL